MKDSDKIYMDTKPHGIAYNCMPDAHYAVRIKELQVIVKSGNERYRFLMEIDQPNNKYHGMPAQYNIYVRIGDPIAERKQYGRLKALNIIMGLESVTPSLLRRNEYRELYKGYVMEATKKTHRNRGQEWVRWLFTGVINNPHVKGEIPEVVEAVKVEDKYDVDEL